LCSPPSSRQEEEIRAVVFSESQARLELRSVPDPTPGVDEVVNRCQCCGGCKSDLHFSEVAGALPSDCVLGHPRSSTIMRATPRARSWSICGRRT